MRDFIKTMIALGGVALWGYLNRAWGYLDGSVTTMKVMLEKDQKKESEKN